MHGLDWIGRVTRPGVVGWEEGIGMARSLGLEGFNASEFCQGLGFVQPVWLAAC
jgi:hypothetical protein